MATIDTPILEQEVNVDTPVADMPTLQQDTPKLDNFKALKAAYLDNYNTGKPVIEAYMEHRGALNKDGTLLQLSQEKLVEDNTAASEVLEEAALEDPAVFVENVEAEQELRQQREQMAGDSTKQFVDAIAAIDADEETKKSVANYVKLYEMLESSMSEYDFIDYTMDFALDILPFVSTGREAKLLGSLVNNEDEVRNLIFNFKSKTFEEQQEMFPQLAEEVLGGIGPIRGGELLTKFIEPSTEDELGDFSNWWKVIDAVDLGSIGATAVIAANRLRHSFNLPKVLNKAENKEAAGDSVAAALADPDAAEAMNITPETAFGDSVAFDISIEDPAYTKGISAEAQESIQKFFGEADKTIEDIMVGNGYLKEGVLNSVERAAKEKIAMSRLSDAKHEEIQIVGRTENTTKFRYKAKDEEGNYFDEDFTLDLTLDDTGQWTQSEMMVGSEFINSPTVFAKGTTRLDVDTAQRLDSQTAKVFRQLTDLQRDAVKPLGNLLRPKNRRRLEKVESVLRMGDEYKNADGTRGKVFTVTELKGEHQLDDDQIKAYYQTNRLYNNLWRLRNNAKREEMIAFKYKQVNMLDDEYSFGKPHDTDGDAYTALVQNKVTSVFDSVSDDVVNTLTKEYVQEQYALGKVLVKMPEPYNAGAGRGKYTHVFVNADSINELPAVVLNRKRGYVPKVAEDGFWFVKERGTEMIDGKEVGSDVKTLRYFDNKAEADRYREQLIEADMKELGLTRKQAEGKYVNREDREQEIIATATGQFSHGSGGLYTAARAEDDILFGINGDAGQRINPYEALVRNIANVSRMVPINQWRLGLEQRWINTARELTGEDIQSFKKFSGTIESTRTGEFLNKMFDQIRDWQGFPSKQEQVYNALNQRMYEWSLRNNFSAGAKLTGWLRNKDPIAASRAAAFHSLLGWFNPAQLWVQAQGMSIAVSINLGKNLTETLRHTTGLTILGQGGDVSKGRISLAAKAAGMDADELLKIQELWKKTGLEDSILQTADHAAAIRGHGIAMDALSQAADKGLLFYRHGEFLNRRMAFTTALDEFRSKAGRFPNDEELKGVLDRTNNLMLNLGRANRAQWQKGIASVPTQFFQVSAKALETVGGFNDNLTSAERMRVLAGQVALYGAAGIPLAGLGANYMLEAMGVTQEDIDNNPVAVKTFNDGFWGFTTLGIFGIDAEVSSRGSLVRGVTDFVDNWMFSESTVATKLMGAFGNTNQRFWDSLTQQLRPITMGAYPTDIIEIGKIPLLPFLDTISTWRNGEKAVFMQSIDAILDRHGDPTVARDFEIRESIAAAIGFRLSDEVQAYNLTERTQHILDANKKIADMIIDRMNEVAIRDSWGTLDEDFLKETEQFYATMYGSLDWDRQDDVRNSVQNRIKRDDKQTRAIKKYLDKVIGNSTESLRIVRDGLIGTNIQTLNKPEEEE